MIQTRNFSDFTYFHICIADMEQSSNVFRRWHKFRIHLCMGYWHKRQLENVQNQTVNLYKRRTAFLRINIFIQIFNLGKRQLMFDIRLV